MRAGACVKRAYRERQRESYVSLRLRESDANERA